MKDQDLVNTLRLKCGGGKKMERDVIGAMRTAFEQSADRIVAAEEYALVLKKEIEKLRAQLPRWIPVTERLPEDPVKKVLVFVPHTHGDIVDAGRYLGADGWVLEGWHLTQNAVTHWMPLPEPPEVENAETQ